MTREVIIQGSHSGAIKVKAGETLSVINLEGSQVADFWAFKDHAADEFLSAEHTRSCLNKLVPEPGDSVYSNLRHPLLTILEDSSPGDHDLLMSACDPRRYELLGHKGYHRSCQENLHQTLKDEGIDCDETPSPFNIFQRVDIDDASRLSINPPHVKAGDLIRFRAERDLTVIVSACPMDIAMTNGPDGKTRPIKLEVTAN